MDLEEKRKVKRGPRGQTGADTPNLCFGKTPEEELRKASLARG